MITSILCAMVISFNVLINNSIVAKWGMETDQGPVSVEFKSDNTYEVDLGRDGQIDIYGSYTISGDQVTVMDKPGENSCTGEGVYTFKVDTTKLTLSKVKDSCPGRGSAEQMVMTKM